ncbi:MAG TPA: PspC domain-containing protein [Phycicoccus sp.]|nr:PspC domain-containing protein [Phycicoccus sp.]
MTTTPPSAPSGQPGFETGPQDPAGHGQQTFTAPPPPPHAGASAAAGTTPSVMQGLWDQLHRLGIQRDRSTGWFGGVCAGIARRVGVDPLLIRALVIILSIAGGFGLVAYVLAWLLLPDAGGKILLREVARGDVTGIVLLVVLSILLFSGISFGEGTWLGGWFIPIAALGIILLVVNHRKVDGRVAVPPSQPGAGGYAPAPQASAATDAGPTSDMSTSTSAAAGAGTDPTPTGGNPMARLTYPETPAPPWASGSIATHPESEGMAYAAPPAYAPAHPTAGSPTGGANFGGPSGPVPPVPTPPVNYGPPVPQRRRAPRGSGAIVLGLAVLGYGLGFLLDGPTQFNGSGHFLGVLIALGITSIAALILGLSGRRGGMASVLSLLLLVPVGASAVVEKAPFGPGEGQLVTWSPTGDAGYNIGAGEATLDLSQLIGTHSNQTAEVPVVPQPPDSASSADPAEPAAPTDPATVPDSRAATLPTSISASVGAGQLVVLVPKGVEVTVHSNVGLGSLDFGPFADGSPGRSDAIGVNQTTVIRTADASENPTPIDLNVSVGLGDLIFKEK